MSPSRPRVGTWLLLAFLVGCRSFVPVDVAGRDTDAFPREIVRITTVDGEIVEGRLLALGETELGLASGRVAYDTIQLLEVSRWTGWGRFLNGTARWALTVGLIVVLIPWP